MRLGRWSGSSMAVAISLAALAGGCDLLGALSDDIPDVPVDNDAMPAISGGTLLVTRDGQQVVAADSEADKIYIVDLATRALVLTAHLPAGSEPGRVEEGSDGRIHVALRSASQLATISLVDAAVTLRNACPEPRGLGYDAAAEQVHMACAGGELVTFDDNPSVTAPLRSLRLDRDLRDVVVQDDMLYVTRFRSAELLVVDAAGNVNKRFEPGSYALSNGNFEAGVAWRARPVGDGLLLVVHQAALSDELPTSAPAPGTAAYYGNASPCAPSVVTAAATVYDMRAGITLTVAGQGNFASAVLPVDIAMSTDLRVAVAAAGSDAVVVTNLGSTIADNISCSNPATVIEVADPVAVAFDLSGRLIVQSRTEGLVFVEEEVGVVANVALPKPALANTGHEIFHKRADPQRSQIACASCHPEGRDDGHVWQFEGMGARRTHSLIGGVLQKGPLHWDGDMPSLHDLVDEVFVNRMAGRQLANSEVNVLGSWMNSMRSLRPSAPVDIQSVARGEQLFYSQAVGCGNCHNGAQLTNGGTVDVGTGKRFKVPSLVGVGFRTPLMHDGCADTVADRFGPCGGGDAHGRTSQLSAWQVGDLVSYLNSL